MSKLVKKMQMDALKATFKDTRDLVLLSMSGIKARDENQIRLQLRKKNIRLHTVKNSLAARVFKDLGIQGLDAHLNGPTTIAWGASSIADLSKAIDEWIQREKKIQPKIAVADGAVVPFEAAKKFPTRAQAIGEVLALVLGSARRVLGQVTGAGGRLAGVVQTLAERKEGEGGV
ncbi:MAG: 50S ribosomal protein L10 [Gemmatales bacterium]|nr:50S ribosomal protein L10 [Gemmatales bacterium]MDW8386789.1 50S ribosomal protein L10 [Gemmatales bacterium]